MVIYGHYFTIVIGHKSLRIIYGSRTSKPSQRIERWMLRLQPYSFCVIYKSRTDNPTDYFSRHPTTTCRKQEQMKEGYGNSVVHNSVLKAMALDEISHAIDQDRVLKGLRAAIRLNQWDYQIVKPNRLIKMNLRLESRIPFLEDLKL